MSVCIAIPPEPSIMDSLSIVKFVICSFALLSAIKYRLVNTNDAEFGRVITFDNFDHFKVSPTKQTYEERKNTNQPIHYVRVKKNCFNHILGVNG